jgi:YVTN family beta-propeller protein
MIPFLIVSTLLSTSVRVYVANSEGSDVTVIDPVTNTVAETIQVSLHPHGIVPAIDKKRFFISSEGDNVLDVVERSSGKVIRRVPLGTRPNNVAITPDGKRVYICIRQDSVVDVVDTASLEKVKSIPVGEYPHNVYMTADGKYMLATALGGKNITAIDVRTEKPAFVIDTAGVPRPVTMENGPGGTPLRLFVQLSNFHGFEVIDYASRKVVEKIKLPEAPPDAKPLIADTFSHGMALSPDGKTLWVNSMLANSVSIYSLPDLKLLDTVPVGRGPDWIAFLPDGSRCYVTNAGADSVSAIDARTHKELARIPTGKVPKRIISVELP